jgi:hypothetical protein
VGYIGSLKPAWATQQDPFSKEFIKKKKTFIRLTVPTATNQYFLLPALLVFFFLVGHLNIGLHAYKAGTLLLEPHFQSILLWLFWRWGLVNYLPRLASNLDPPDLNLPSRWDYRRESPGPSYLPCPIPFLVKQSMLFILFIFAEIFYDSINKNMKKGELVLVIKGR